jgi:hypothetical protein
VEVEDAATVKGGLGGLGLRPVMGEASVPASWAMQLIRCYNC